MNIVKKIAIAICLTAGLAVYTHLAGMLGSSDDTAGIASMEMRLDGPAPCVADACAMSKVARR